jgi:hypothetical protein
MSIFWGLGELVSHRFCFRLDVNFPGNTKNYTLVFECHHLTRCRYHLEIKYVFKCVMENRRNINRTREESNQLKIYKYEICNETLCAKTDEGFHLRNN